MIGRALPDSYVADLFASLADEKHYVFLDTSLPDALNRQSLLFTRPLSRLECRCGDDLHLFFDRLSRFLDEGYYLAGWFGYEFFHDQGARTGAGPLLADLGVYRAPRTFDHQSGAGDFPENDGRGAVREPYRLDDLRPNMQRNQYCRAIDAILGHIAAGDTYQVNYTFKFTFGFSGSVSSLYRDLRRSQPVPYGCCIRSGDDYILSFSPELFFRADDAGRITARPMKGTMARGRTGPEDELLAAALNSDEKNRSENVMIVDLLRNDLSRLVAAHGGSVQVSSLFDVERYRSVFQMTSTVVAQCSEGAGLQPAEMMRALFPCGSVTGAPKIRTMEIIDELERGPRGVYTGAIGYFSPERGAVFNVPIRTVVLTGDRGEMGIGSGIVADSSPESEWQECLLKARFLTHPPPEFTLIETMAYDSETGFLFLEGHLSRLAASAGYFDFTCDESGLRSEIDRFVSSLAPAGWHRIRLRLAPDGSVGLAATPCDAPGPQRLPAGTENGTGERVAIGLAAERTEAASVWLFHKTSRRELYDRIHRQARAAGLFDMVFCNERGEITEGCITNLFVLKNGCYYTPPLHCGLLDGVMRRHLLSTPGPLPVRERVLYRHDLEEADALFVCNSVRGVRSARLSGP